MARDSEFQRERKKKQLRQSMVTNDKVRSAPVAGLRIIEEQSMSQELLSQCWC